jgi:hypothetical protein
LIDNAYHILPYKSLDTFVRAVHEFLAEYHRPLTSSSDDTAQNVALDVR